MEWRWINNDHKFIKQADIGQLSGPSIVQQMEIIGVH